MEFVILDGFYGQHQAEEEFMAAQQDRRVRFRGLRDTSDPFTATEIAFMGMYRLTKDLARDLIEDLRPFFHEGQRATSVPLELRVLCALHFYAQGSYQKGVGSDNAIALSQLCVSRAIEEVTEAINQPNTLTQSFQFPLDVEGRRALQQRNFRNCRIPGVLGFVDGTHIAIVRPAEHEELFVNRKGYHSIKAQIVCDSEYKILNVVSRYCGSSHDAFIWANSSVTRLLENCWQEGERLWLLGDSGYPLEPWLHTPIFNAAPESPEENYTKLHLAARSTVERCIGLLKNRFRCLLKHRVLHYNPLKAGRIMNACRVLHNRCISVRLPHEEGHRDEPEVEPHQNPRVLPNQRGNPIHREGVQVRAGGVNRVWPHSLP